MKKKPVGVFPVLLVWCLGTFFSSNGKESYRDFWWQILMEVSVTGEYESRQNGESCSGRYDFVILYRGGMERDNGDYLFYQGEGKIKRLEWIERVSRGTRNKATDLSGEIKPVMKVNYVLRQFRKVHFDFEISSVSVPADGLTASREILLPRSAENSRLRRGERYNKGIARGSNRVYTAERPIYKPGEVSKRFSWVWKRGELSGSQSHRVEVVLELKKFTRNKGGSGENREPPVK